MNTNKYLNKIKDIINKNIDTGKTSVFLFGSRTGSSCSFASDIDIGLLDSSAIDNKIIMRIKNEIEESIIPFHVDIVDFAAVSHSFKEIAMEKIIVWNKGRFLN